MDELYKLLDDCHTALAKTTLDDKQYNDLSTRLIAQKQALLQANVSGMFSLATVKKAFETFHYVGFPHNEPTWEQWAKENLR